MVKWVSFVVLGLVNHFVSTGRKVAFAGSDSLEGKLPCFGDYLGAKGNGVKKDEREKQTQMATGFEHKIIHLTFIHRVPKRQRQPIDR